MTVDPTSRFVELVQGPEDRLGASLDLASLLIAAHANPDLDVEAYLGRLDRLAAASEEPTLEALIAHLFGPQGFRGDRDNYYDPRNSYLDQVLDRRLGIPITLSVVLIEVGRRLGLRLVGVGMPGHLLVRHEEEPPVILDAFERGKVLTPEECEERFHAVHGAEVRFDPSYLVPIGPRAMVARMLANLKRVHAARGDGRSLEWVLRLRTALPDVGDQDRLDLAEVLTARGRFAEAASMLETMSPLSGEADQESPRSKATRLRARLN